MNEKQGTRVKASDRTVIYMCWEKSVFYNAVTLGISTMPGQASSSGVVDQDINKLHSVLCSFNLLQGLERVILFSWFCCIFIFEKELKI